MEEGPRRGTLDWLRRWLIQHTWWRGSEPVGSCLRDSWAVGGRLLVPVKRLPRSPSRLQTHPSNNTCSTPRCEALIPLSCGARRPSSGEALKASVTFRLDQVGLDLRELRDLLLCLVFFKRAHKSNVRCGFVKEFRGVLERDWEIVVCYGGGFSRIFGGVCSWFLRCTVVCSFWSTCDDLKCAISLFGRTLLKRLARTLTRLRSPSFLLGEYSGGDSNRAG